MHESSNININFLADRHVCCRVLHVLQPKGRSKRSLYVRNIKSSTRYTTAAKVYVQTFHRFVVRNFIIYVQSYEFALDTNNYAKTTLYTVV